MPAIASGHDRGPGPQGDQRGPVAERPDAGPAGPLTVPSGIWTNTAAVADDRAGRGHVIVDADAAAPDRQQAAHAVDQPLAPARR